MLKKLMTIVPLVLVALGVGYKLAPFNSAPPPKPKIDGTVYVLPKVFIVNLERGRIVKLNVGLVLEPDAEIAAEEGGHGGGTKPPEGFGSLPQEAVARSIFTEVLSGQDADRLLTAKGRRHLKAEILEDLERNSDIHARGVLFTDLTIQ